MGGWMLDAMDVQIFSFAIPAIIVAFAITNADAGLIARDVAHVRFGGWFAGALFNIFGRVRTLQITISMWFAFSVPCVGFAQTYAQLFTFRALIRDRLRRGGGRVRWAK